MTRRKPPDAERDGPDLLAALADARSEPRPEEMDPSGGTLGEALRALGIVGVHPDPWTDPDAERAVERLRLLLTERERLRNVLRGHALERAHVLRALRSLAALGGFDPEPDSPHLLTLTWIAGRGPRPADAREAEHYAAMLDATDVLARLRAADRLLARAAATVADADVKALSDGYVDGSDRAGALTVKAAKFLCEALVAIRAHERSLTPAEQRAQERTGRVVPWDRIVGARGALPAILFSVTVPPADAARLLRRKIDSAAFRTELRERRRAPTVTFASKLLGELGIRSPQQLARDRKRRGAVDPERQARARKARSRH